jgi:hypothetical protein
MDIFFNETLMDEKNMWMDKQMRYKMMVATSAS